MVVTSLLTELIFTGGSIVKLSDLLELFRKRFEITVNATGLSTICEVLRESTFQVRGSEQEAQLHHLFMYAVFIF